MVHIVEEYRYDDNGNRTYEMNELRAITGRTFTHSVEDHTLTAGPISYEFDCAGTGPGLELSVFPSRNDKSRAGVCITNQADPGSVTLHLIALPLN
jgi:hypothetical protein